MSATRSRVNWITALFLFGSLAVAAIGTPLYLWRFGLSEDIELRIRPTDPNAGRTGVRFYRKDGAFESSPIWPGEFELTKTS